MNIKKGVDVDLVGLFFLLGLQKRVHVPRLLRPEEELIILDAPRFSALEGSVGRHSGFLDLRISRTTEKKSILHIDLLHGRGLKKLRFPLRREVLRLVSGHLPFVL